MAEYGVLGQPQTAADKLTKAELGKALWASGVIMSGTRFLAVTATGVPVYLVPAEHLLAFRLAPDRCFSPAQRSLEQTLRPYLRREYAHHALCLLTLYAGNSTSTCSAAPGIADAFVDGPGNPGFGLAPNGVSNVLVQYVSQPSLSVAVQRNFWVVDTIWASGAAPCGVDWLNGAVVLRTVKRC